MIAKIDAPSSRGYETSSEYVVKLDPIKSGPLLLLVIGAVTATSVLLGAPPAIGLSGTSVVERAPLVAPQRVVESTSDLIKRVRGLSGLTWEQFARALNVSRRAVHHWSSGGRLNGTNLALVAEFDRLLGALGPVNAEDARRLLVTADDSGESPLDAFRKLALSSYALVQPRAASLEATLDPS